MYKSQAFKLKFLFFLFLFFGIERGYSQKQTNEPVDSLLQNGMNMMHSYPNESIKIADQFLENEKATIPQRMMAYHIKGNAYAVIGEYREAIKNSYEFKKYAEKIGSAYFLGLALANIAGDYRRLRLYDKSILYYGRSIKKLNEVPHDEQSQILKATILIQIGSLEYFRDNHHEAEVHLQASLKFFDEFENKNKVICYYPSNYALLGLNYASLDQIDSANYYLKKAQNVSCQLNDRYVIVNILYGFGAIHYKENNYQHSIDSLLKAEHILTSENLNFELSKYKIYELLADNYGKLKDYKNQAKWIQKVKEIDHNMDKTKSSALTMVLDRNDLENSKRIDDIEKVNKQIIVGFFLMMFAFGVVFFYKKPKKKKIEKAVVAEENSLLEVAPKLTCLKQEKEILTEVEEKTLRVSFEKEAEILEKLKKFEESGKFTNKNITIASLSSQFNTNTNYLSKIINKHKGKNFSSYINELRINYIVDKIVNRPEYRNYKISYLAEECGFKSHSVFTTTFKNQLAMSPHDFITITSRNNYTSV